MATEPLPRRTKLVPGLFGFQRLHVDASTRARRGRFATLHGPVETPAFMPVGTQGSVKGILADQLRETGAKMILANTYHLATRPGAEVVRALGGLHRFMGWDGPILTDSGGFQIFSLAQQVQVDEERALFRSHVDGREISLSPEQAVAVQEQLGSDVAMVLDQVVPLPSDPDLVRLACERSVRWAVRCRAAHRRDDQAQFAIVQGGLDSDLRVWCAESLRAIGFEGYAIGGLSVGETPEQMYEILESTTPALPDDRPRYLMGVGRPQDLLAGIRRGIDLFDCVMPTRNGRNALAFTDDGTLRLRNSMYQTDDRPLDDSCGCPACRHSRGYLRHLFTAGEMLGPVLVSIHNLTYYHRLMDQARTAIEADAFDTFERTKRNGWEVSAGN